MNVNLELYKAFYYVGKNKSISKAADELMISQPAISRSIKTLEGQLNVNLFIRKRDGVELSEAGLLIFDKVKNAIMLIENAENEISSFKKLDFGYINIGASKTILHEFLMKYITEFHKEFPNIVIRVYTDKTSLLIKKSKIGLIDIIFTNLDDNDYSDFENVRLIKINDCLAVNESYSNLKDKVISNNELEELPFILLTKGTTSRNIFDNVCNKNDIRINPIMEFGSNSLVKEFTLSGFGVGLLTEEFVKDEIKSGKLIKLNTKLNLGSKYIGMLYTKESINYAAKEFISHIKNSIYELHPLE